jgi:predicted molibdopterin-dependent oxidoreductase YjgC
MSARFARLAETARQPVAIRIDGVSVTALSGDTVLTAVLTAADHVRSSEFGAERRAGFCLMGACQDCWMWTEAGERLRACTTTVTDGLGVRTTSPDVHWADAPPTAEPP